MSKTLTEETQLPYVFDLNYAVKEGYQILRAQRELLENPDFCRTLAEQGYDVEQVRHDARVTPERIEHLYGGEIFVYDANEAGRHGAGAAKQAIKFGARYGVVGLEGATYGLCTKDAQLNTLPLDDIREEVLLFAATVNTLPYQHFLVTKLGMGLAGLSIDDIAPMFRQFKDIPNVSLPQAFFDWFERNPST